ncbi:hypothetical protein CEP54_015899 [Fusarium duplospermum]|uniref:DNA2/NAM7 helicase-like C-terminal domain-containing protein n=1 Tax=Fusarium duplospermum TaxID=1325734 RepID=A0A428NKF3_9HYPO|nr:hypothetical protein CEP54_015899 [Fusarium duplospermum]
MLRNAPVWTGTSDNDEDSQPPRLGLPDGDEGSIDFPEPQATLFEMTLTREWAMQLTGDLIEGMDDNQRRRRPDFKTTVLKWLDETTIKVLPSEAKTTVLFWCQSFAPEWVPKVEAALENDLHHCDYEQIVPGHPVEMRSANMGMHALKKIYDIVKALPDDCVQERQSLVANCREVKEVLTCLNEKSQGYLTIMSNLTTQCNTLSAHCQQLQELCDNISSDINTVIKEKTTNKTGELELMGNEHLSASEDESVVTFPRRRHISPVAQPFPDVTEEDLSVASPIDKDHDSLTVEQLSDVTMEQFPVQPRRAQRPESDPAGICFPGHDAGIGDWIFACSKIQIRLRKANPGNHVGYFALTLGFPRSSDRAHGTCYRGSRPGDLSPSDKYQVFVRFPENSIVKVDRLSDSDFEIMKPSLRLTDTNDYWFVSVTYPDGKDATVVRTMLPYVGQTDEMTRWFTEDEHVEGKVRLSHLLSKRDWKFLMRFSSDDRADWYSDTTGIDTTPFGYGYGNEHNWDDERYDITIPRNLGTGFSATTEYENQNNRDTALEQVHAQDKIATQETDSRFIALVTVGEDWLLRYREVLNRSITKVGTQFKVTIFCPGLVEDDEYNLPDAEPLESEEQVQMDYDEDNDEDARDSPALKQATWKPMNLPANSVHLRGINTKGRLAMVISRPPKGAEDHHFIPVIFDSSHAAKTTSKGSDELNTVAILGDPGIRNEKKRVAAVFRLRQDARVWPSTAQHNARLKPLLNDILTGNGVGFTPRHDNLGSARPIGQPPAWNIFNLGAHPRVIELCEMKFDEDDRLRFLAYFSKLAFGVAVVSAPSGSGKSRLSSIVATLFGHSVSIGKTIVSAPSNSACSNIEEKIHSMNSEITDELVNEGQELRSLMSVRGYAIDRETRNCFQILCGSEYCESDELDASPWKFHHSLCWWTFLVLGYNIADMKPLSLGQDNKELCDLHLRLEALLDIPGPTTEGTLHEEDDAESKGAPKETPFESFADLVKIARGALIIHEYTERQIALKREFTLRKDIVRLMSQVVMCSNFVVVTPSIAASEPYQTYNDQYARAVILDEAAAMHRTDGLIVYGNTPRPMIVVGDEKQLAPTLITANQKDNAGNDINRFSDDAKISFLSWWLHLGFPAFHLYKQHRMARGMFDLSLELVYHDLKDEFVYAESCALTNFSYASDIRAYLQHTANLVLPADTMAPVFMNCNNCPSRVDPVTQSRYNPRAVDCMVKWLKAFIGELSVPADRIAVITPYRANLQHIRSRFSAEPTLRGIEASTINTFMGREADVILLCLAADKESGPKFTAHPRRLNVAITRHKTAWFVFGDINTIPPSDPEKPRRPRTEDATAEDGAPVRVSLAMMTKMFQWFRDNGMIIHLQGDPNVDPDA